MKIIYGGDFSPAYTRRQIDIEHAARLEKYNTERRAPYSKPCETCGKTFVGTNWRLDEKNFCSEECELAQYKSLHFSRLYEIKLFWRDIGKDFRLLDEISTED